MAVQNFAKQFRRLINQAADLLMFTQLIQAANDCNCILKSGEPTSPIQLAVVENRLDVVKLLIHRGASLQPLEIHPKRPNPYPEFDDSLLDDDDRFTGDPVSTAAAQGHQEIFDFVAPLASPTQRRVAVQLLGEGIKRNSVSDAIDDSRFQVVLDRRPDNQSNDFGQWLTDLMESTIVRISPKELFHNQSLAFAEKARQRVLNGDGVDMILDNGVTLLWIAALNGYVEAVNVLLELGASVDIPNQTDNWTPLMIAADVHIPWVFGTKDVWGESYSRQPEIIRLLVQAGADINRLKNSDEVALHLTDEFYCDQGYDGNLFETAASEILMLLSE